MRKAAICTLLAALLGACGSAQPKRYFQIRSVASKDPALPKVARRLLVESASVAPLYDDIRILYRVSDFELKYYPYEFWAEKPGKQAGDAMAAFLTIKKVFPSIIRVSVDTAEGEPEIVLRSRVHVLEEIDTPGTWWEARLAMDLEFLDFKTGRSIVSSSFDRTGRMGKQVRDLPAVVSGILDDELAKLVWELARALEKK